VRFSRMIRLWMPRVLLGLSLLLVASWIISYRYRVSSLITLGNGTFYAVRLNGGQLRAEYDNTEGGGAFRLRCWANLYRPKSIPFYEEHGVSRYGFFLAIPSIGGTKQAFPKESYLIVGVPLWVLAVLAAVASAVFWKTARSKTERAFPLGNRNAGA